jgi:hypothetical protein
MPCLAGRRLEPLVWMSWDDVVRSMVSEGSVWGPPSLHTAEVTGSIPVTPTSTNTFLGPCWVACCQQIASKPPTVVAVAPKALPVSRVIPAFGQRPGFSSGSHRGRTPSGVCHPPLARRQPRGSNPAPGCFAVRGGSGGRPMTCGSDSSTVAVGCPLGTSGSRCGADLARTSGPCTLLRRCFAGRALIGPGWSAWRWTIFHSPFSRR